MVLWFLKKQAETPQPVLNTFCIYCWQKSDCVTVNNPALSLVLLVNNRADDMNTVVCHQSYLNRFPAQANNNVHLLFLSIPCLRTSSTAAVSSSFRNWLSFAIFSPFSRKFWVAVSTDAAKTWAFLERPFFLFEGPLLLELTNVVTYAWQGYKMRQINNSTMGMSV